MCQKLQKQLKAGGPWGPPLIWVQERERDLSGGKRACLGIGRDPEERLQLGLLDTGEWNFCFFFLPFFPGNAKL